MYSTRYHRSSPQRRRSTALMALVVCLVLAVAGFGLYRSLHTTNAANVASAAKTKTTNNSQQTTQPQSGSPASPSKPDTPCTTNSLAQDVIISINKRHLWACSGQSLAYDSAVVTGMQKLAADLTPTGVYHIYGKQTNLYLNGSDSTGSWHDYVYYWMPFLNNQYGTYGFHDATWRQDSAFGNIDPYSSDASHGCVELPLVTAKWLYNWAAIGTTVTITT